MIIALKTERTKVLDDWVDDFNNPKDINIALVRSSVFVENSAEFIDGMVIIKHKPIFEIFAKYGIVSSVGLILLYFFYPTIFLMNLGIVGFFVCMSLLSPQVKFLIYRLRLYILGHRVKVELVNNNFLLEYLLMERNKNVTK